MQHISNNFCVWILLTLKLCDWKTQLTILWKTLKQMASFFFIQNFIFSWWQESERCYSYAISREVTVVLSYSIRIHCLTGNYSSLLSFVLISMSQNVAMNIPFTYITDVYKRLWMFHRASPLHSYTCLLMASLAQVLKCTPCINERCVINSVLTL